MPQSAVSINLQQNFEDYGKIFKESEIIMNYMGQGFSLRLPIKGGKPKESWWPLSLTYGFFTVCSCVAYYYMKEKHLKDKTQAKKEEITFGQYESLAFKVGEFLAKKNT
jgi:hypothetical protein